MPTTRSTARTAPNAACTVRTTDNRFFISFRDQKRRSTKRKTRQNHGPVRTNRAALPLKQAVGSAHRVVVDNKVHFERPARDCGDRRSPVKSTQGDPECARCDCDLPLAL